MLEYVLIAIVVGMASLFLIYRFSGSLAGRWKSSAREVEGYRVGGGPQTVAKAEGGGVPESLPGAAEGEPTPIGSSEPSDGKVHVGNFVFDFSTILWLGLAVLAIASVITMRLFSAAKAKPKADIDV